MDKELKRFEKRIKKKHSIGWTPQYAEETRTKLNEKVFATVVIRAIEKLGWDVVFQDDLLVEAKRKGHFNIWTEKISMTLEYGKIRVESSSLGNEFWDNGRNSKRVKLFLHVLEEMEKQLDKADLLVLEKEIERTNNWDDYEIPAHLPPPPIRKEPRIIIPILGGILLAILLGFIIAFLTFKFIYIIFLYEVIAALIISFVLKNLIRISHFTDFQQLNYIIIGTVLLTYFANQYFLYQLVIHENSVIGVSFFDFIKMRLAEGLTLKSINMGWIGLLISWALQVVLTWAIAHIQLASNLINYLLDRVPSEVIDFVYYHHLKEKTDLEIRAELSEKGWTRKEDQDEAYEALGAIYSASEMNR